MLYDCQCFTFAAAAVFSASHSIFIHTQSAKVGRDICVLIYRSQCMCYLIYIIFISSVRSSVCICYVWVGVRLYVHE